MNSITPLSGFDQEKYPFYLVRSNRLFLVNAKKLEIVELWHEDIDYFKVKFDTGPTQVYRSYKSVASVEKNAVVTFGAHSANDYWSGSIFRIVFNEDTSKTLDTLHA